MHERLPVMFFRLYNAQPKAKATTAKVHPFCIVCTRCSCSISELTKVVPVADIDYSSVFYKNYGMKPVLMKGDEAYTEKESWNRRMVSKRANQQRTQGGWSFMMPRLPFWPFN